MKKIVGVWLGVLAGTGAFAQPSAVPAGSPGLVRPAASPAHPVTTQDLSNELQKVVAQGLPGVSAALATRQA